MAQAAQAAGVPPASLAEAIARDLAEVEVTYDYERLRALITHAAERFTALVHGHFHNAASRLVAAAKAHIAAHLDDPALSLGLLAAQLHVNPSYLCRRFAKAEEMGVVDYIRRARIERARCLLLDRTRTVTDVAFAVGFGSVQQFGRAFRTLTGTTPSAYRQAKSDQERSIPV
jgi:AraC-like DNA-binding protein